MITKFTKKLVKDIGIWVIEGKSGIEFDLIRLSSMLKNTAEGFILDYADISSACKLENKTIDFYRDIIVENAEKKNYGYKLTKDILNHLRN